VSTTDGRFAETKEQLGGFYLITARDLNDALEVTSRIPSADHGVQPSISWGPAGVFEIGDRFTDGRARRKLLRSPRARRARGASSARFVPVCGYAVIS
jgi:hypothetical protein